MKVLSTGMGWIESTPGGLNRYFSDYLKAMQINGHEMRGLITGNGAELDIPDYMIDTSKGVSSAHVINRANLFRNSIKSLISTFQPDIINPHFALYFSLVNHNLIPEHIPIVTHFHGPWAQESTVETTRNLIMNVKNKSKKSLEKITYRRSDSFIVLSEYFKNILMEDYGIDESKINIIPGAVNTEYFQPAEDREEIRRRKGIDITDKVLFCARRLVRRMGIDNLVKAMGKVVTEYPHTKLYIAGQGYLRQELESLIRNLRLENNVYLLGKITNDELLNWYQIADFSIVPTITLEGFGLVTVESLACGTPVLGTPYGGTKEILQKLDEQLLFRDSSDQAIASKLEDILSGQLKLPNREHCRKFVMENYTWDKVVDAVSTVFDNSMNRKTIDIYN